MMNEDEDLPDDEIAGIADPSIVEPIAEPKRRESHGVPTWFLPAIIGAIAWAGLGIWLSQQSHWPEGYGYHFDCVYRACLIMSMIYSPALLAHPTVYSLGLFAWYAATAAFLLWAIGRAAVRNSSAKVALLLTLVAAAIAFILLSPGGGAHG